MESITLDSLIENYVKLVDKGKIQFLRTGSGDQKKVRKLARTLQREIQKAAPGELGESLDWHTIHMYGRELWEKLTSCALHDLDAGAKGNSTLFSYLTAATEFEDLLYGLDKYYRDHTVHSLWVYFIGEHILRNLIPDIYENLDWYVYNDVEREKALYDEEPSLVEKAKEKNALLCRKVNQKKDAVWCMMALCHDLGYSLSKLDDLNDKVQSVLDYFSLPHISHIGYSLDVEHQYNIGQFLELMSVDVHIVARTLAEDPVIKCFRDDSTYWRLCQALEKKQHGILSAYLIYKIIDLFADIAVRDPAEEWGLADDEAVDNIIRGDILFAIAQHEFEFAHLQQLSSLADVLFLADDIEEFSRYGRQLQSRKYRDTMATSQIEFVPSKPKPGQDITVNIAFEVAEHGSLAKFFVRKAEHLCRIYSLDQEKAENGCTITSIMVTAQKGRKKLSFNLCDDPDKTKGFLPPTKIDDVVYKEKEYALTCQDDRVYVVTNGDEISLREWIGNVAGQWWKNDQSYE